jgi:hypothetical protein
MLLKQEQVKMGNGANPQKKNFSEVTVKMCNYFLSTGFQQIYFFPLQPPPIEVLRSQFEDRAMWPHERPLFLEGAQGLLLNQQTAAQKDKPRVS